MNRKHRLKSNDDFQRVFKHGKSFANRQLVLYYFPQHDQSFFRIGFSVSKKIGNAVVRNRLKRHFRQAIHEMEQEIKPFYDFVIIARQPVKEMDYHQIKKSMTHLFSKTNLFIK